MSKRDVRNNLQEQVKFFAQFSGLSRPELESLAAYSTKPADYSPKQLSDDLYVITHALQRNINSYRGEASRIARTLAVEHGEVEAEQPHRYTLPDMIGDIITISAGAKAALLSREIGWRSVSEQLKDREFDICFLKKELQGDYDEPKQ